MSAEHVWDAVVIGAGMGGAFAALELGRQGLSVLVLECGTPPDETPPGPRQRSRLGGRARGHDAAFAPGYWPERMTVRGSSRLWGKSSHEIPAVLGTGPGGSSLVYGAALGRLRRRDFDENTVRMQEGGPDTAYPNDWPVSYDSMATFYAEAEALLRVAGTPDPLDLDDEMSLLVPPPPLGRRESALMDLLLANGRHPFRLHMGLDYQAGCSECLGVPCPRHCKADAMSRALAPALRDHDVTLEIGRRVTRIERNGDFVVYSGGPRGEARHVGRTLVLAAGALNTPRLLAAAPALWPGGSPSPLLGRGLMFHASDLFAVIGHGNGDSSDMRKTLAFRDHYDDAGLPLGEVQSVGQNVSAGMIERYLKGEARRIGFGLAAPVLHGLRVPARLAARLFPASTLFATIVEDFPYDENRLDTAAQDIAVHYRVPRELDARLRRMRRLVRESFAPRRVVFLTLLGTPNFGHPCGTCRMGTDPAFSVTTAEGHLWHDDRVVVADASAFSSSGGTNPALTVAAHALRVSRALADRLHHAPAERTHTAFRREKT